jgi:hypothetical protein
MRPGQKIAQIGLTSSCLLDQTDYLLVSLFVFIGKQIDNAGKVQFR